MKKLIIICLLVGFSSCAPVDHDVEVTVENNSESEIRDIRFITDTQKEGIWFDKLKPSESSTVTVNVKNYDADGNYTFEYLLPDGKKIERSGNYLEEEYIKTSLKFNVVNGGVEIEKKTLKKNT